MSVSPTPTAHSSDTFSQNPWYGRWWVIAAVALVMGFAIGSGSHANATDSGPYKNLNQKYSSVKLKLSAADSQLADIAEREQALAQREASLDATQQTLDDRTKKLDALEKRLKDEEKSSNARATPPAAAPRAHATTKPKTTAPVSCTRTSSGSCIQGGQFCKKALYGQSGIDGSGRRYTCTGDSSHPHWMRG